MKPQAMSEKIDFKLVSDYLHDTGCCKICVLRFLKPNIDDFLEVDYALKNVNIRRNCKMLKTPTPDIYSTERNYNITWQRLTRQETEIKCLCRVLRSVRLHRWNRVESEIKWNFEPVWSEAISVVVFASRIPWPCTTSDLACAYREISQHIWER